MNQLIGDFGQILLVEFDMLVDTEYGLIRLLRDKYANEQFFFRDILNLDDKLLKGVLMNRSMFNPLQVAFKDESQVEYMDSFYEQFITQKYEDILARSCLTTLVMFVKRCIDAESGIKIAIVCKNEAQVAYIKHIMSDCLAQLYSVILDKEDLFDVTNYPVLYIKDCRSLVHYKNLHGKVIYVANMNYNRDQELAAKGELSIKPEFNFIITSNQIKFITLYPYDNSYSINGDFIREDVTLDIDEENTNGLDDGFIERVFGGQRK